MIFRDRTNRRVGEAVFLGERCELAIPVARQAIGGSDPKAAIACGPQRVDAVGGKRTVFPGEDREVVSVKSSQALVGSEPHVAIASLGDRANRVLWEAMLFSPDGVRVLGELPVGVQSEQKPGARDQQGWPCYPHWIHF